MPVMTTFNRIVFERDAGTVWTATAETASGEIIAAGQGPSIGEARAALDAALLMEPSAQAQSPRRATTG